MLSLTLLNSFQAGVEQLFNQLLRPKLRTFIADIYRDVSYVLDEDTYAAAELQDTVRKRFVKAWETLIESYKVDMSVYFYQPIYSPLFRTPSLPAISDYFSVSH